MKKTGFKPRKTPMRNRTPMRKCSPRRSAVVSGDTKTRGAALARDGNQCKFAGWMIKCNGQLENCHIYPKKTYPHMRHMVENTIIGCRAHHDYQHDHPKEGRKKMFEIVGYPTVTYLEEVAKKPAGVRPEACAHDYPNAVKISRALWLCPNCKTDISLTYFLLCEAEARNKPEPKESQ